MVPKFDSQNLLGIDLSHWCPAVAWDTARSKVAWCYTKATDGLNFKDPSLHMHFLGAQDAGVAASAYHFLRAHYTGDDQATFFLDAINGLKLDFPAILDWEQDSAEGMSSATQQLHAYAWLCKVEEATGRTPMIYTGLAFMQELKVDPKFARFPVIVARYQAPDCPCPKPWQKLAGWQWSEKGIVPGLAEGHTVDCNVFYGTIEELKAL